MKSMVIFLRFSKVNIETDCRSILFLKAAKGTSDVLTRYSTQLTAYNISITHIPGRENCIADALSRSRESANDLSEIPYMNQDEAEILLSVLKLPKNTTITPNEVKRILQGTGLPSLIKNKLNERKKKKQQVIPLSSLQRLTSNVFKDHDHIDTRPLLHLIRLPDRPDIDTLNLKK